MTLRAAAPFVLANMTGVMFIIGALVYGEGRKHFVKQPAERGGL